LGKGTIIGVRMADAIGDMGDFRPHNVNHTPPEVPQARINPQNPHVFPLVLGGTALARTENIRQALSQKLGKTVQMQKAAFWQERATSGVISQNLFNKNKKKFDGQPCAPCKSALRGLGLLCRCSKTISQPSEAECRFFVVQFGKDSRNVQL
jgi:hypothetical protein